MFTFNKIGNMIEINCAEYKFNFVFDLTKIVAIEKGVTESHRPVRTKDNIRIIFANGYVMTLINLEGLYNRLVQELMERNND